MLSHVHICILYLYGYICFSFTAWADTYHVLMPKMGFMQLLFEHTCEDMCTYAHIPFWNCFVNKRKLTQQLCQVQRKLRFSHIVWFGVRGSKLFGNGGWCGAMCTLGGTRHIYYFEYVYDVSDAVFYTYLDVWVRWEQAIGIILFVGIDLSAIEENVSTFTINLVRFFDDILWQYRQKSTSGLIANASNHEEGVWFYFLNCFPSSYMRRETKLINEVVFEWN